MTIQIDNRAFEMTAQAVLIMNPYAGEKYAEPSELVEFMQYLAREYAGRSDYFSTGGFVLSFYDMSDGTIGVTASVQAFTALEYAMGRTRKRAA